MCCSSWVGGSLSLCSDPLQSLAKIDLKLGKCSFVAPGSADQDVIGTLDPSLRKDDSGDFSKPPLHSVASDGVADLLRYGETEPKRVVAIVARPDEKDEAGHGRASTAVRGKEIRAAGELDDRWRF